jgi:hypothetical protein
MGNGEMCNLSEPGRTLRAITGIVLLLLFLYLYFTSPLIPKLLLSLVAFAGTLALLEALCGVCVWHAFKGTKEIIPFKKSTKLPSAYSPKVMRCTMIMLLFSAAVALIIYFFV